MLSKRKLYLFALLCGILIIMIATHTVQKSSFLPMSAVNATVRTPTKDRELVQSTAVPNPGRPCSCTRCVSELGLSEWFDQRFKPLQQPFLTAGNGHINPNALRWWLALQRSLEEVTMEEVIQRMFHVISDPPNDTASRSNRCRRCAVVGNSGNLVGSQYGEEIDSHTHVIRMNKAVTAGFEKDVGRRTTHHFMYPESAVDLAPGVHLVLLPFKLRDLQWVASALSTGEIKTYPAPPENATYMRVKERVKADKDKVIVVNPGFYKYVHDNWTEHHGRYPSTGLLAIIFALHTCDEVSVFGYGADQHGNWHHYWENNKYAGAFRKTGVHSADFETEVIQKLDAERKIKLNR